MLVGTSFGRSVTQSKRLYRASEVAGPNRHRILLLAGHLSLDHALRVVSLAEKEYRFDHGD